MGSSEVNTHGIIAAKIHNTALTVRSSIRDWRAGNFKKSTRIEALDDFPKELTQLCVAHVKALGLNFGALDFVVDKHGEFWFLENNPNGQWAFIEVATGQPIGKAIADLLTTGPT